jgi:hypothetical protein
MNKYFVEANGSKAKVLEIYESFSGWYWYTTEKNFKEDRLLRFGLVRGLETEWGYWSLEEMEPLMREGKIWRVEKKDWIGVPLLKEEIEA